ncbi:MAG TPA: GNAT family N-acetyltransferase [Candidatus Micrarchaeaceae archaeon]|nr:GNAT family N-acetyltransferase [Candidatus Micrarchaeaceae archaeon]
MEGPARDEVAQARERVRLLSIFDAQMRGGDRMQLPAGVHQEADGPVHRRWGGGARGLVTGPSLAQLEDRQLDALIEKQIAFFEQLNLAFEWKTYAHDGRADLPRRLTSHGLIPEEPESLVIGRISELTQEPQLPERVGLREAHSRADADQLAELLSTVAGADRGYLGRLFFEEHLANPDHVVLLVAESAGKVVASARLNLEPGSEFGSLWSGSVLPEWRGQGIYRALVAWRAQRAAARGYRYLQVDATESSRPILERLGFQTVGSTTPYCWTPSRVAPARRGAEAPVSEAQST